MNKSINDFSVITFAQLEKEKVLINKHVIEFNRYNGFLKYNFETTYEKIYRTRYCEIAKKKMFWNFFLLASRLAKAYFESGTKSNRCEFNHKCVATLAAYPSKIAHDHFR